MSLPRFCKVCRLIMHYPDLKKEDYSIFEGAFYGLGHCPDNHYYVELKETDDSTEILLEAYTYAEYKVEIFPKEKIVYIYKDKIRIVVEVEYDLFKNYDVKNKDYMINKLDTLVNFS